MQIVGLQRQAEAKVNQLEPRKLALYKELMQRANALQVPTQAKRVPPAQSRLVWMHTVSHPSFSASKLDSQKAPVPLSVD